MVFKFSRVKKIYSKNMGVNNSETHGGFLYTLSEV